MRAMSSRRAADPPRFYSDLARWWPLISPVEEYRGEAAEFVRVLRGALPAAASVLELGSGGGHNAFYMKRAFQLTLSDLSPDMLASSRALNPECEHVRGDMRSLRLGRSFDAVFVQDAVDYMYPESELTAAIATAFAHCRPGGIALFVPDEVQETYAPDTSCGGSDGLDGAGARYLAWSYDPDPTTAARRPNTPSSCASATARSAAAPRPTSTACTPVRPGCACWPRRASRPRYA
jgi:SAM-dependent methyltransferase